MCTPDFSNISINSLFHHCDDLSTRNPADITHNLLSYLAWSSNPNFDYRLCYQEMSNRIQTGTSHYNFNSWESPIFTRRIKLISSNNKAFDLAMKVAPTAEDLEEFSRIDPCFATLFPVKCYIADHLELAKDYKGMLPFGREVIKFYNTIVPADQVIKGSPTYRDHINLRDLSNRKAILMGVPSITINNLMYQFGRSMQNQDPEDTDE